MSGCLLCNSEVKTVGSVNVTTLKKLYWKGFKIDVGSEFKNCDELNLQHCPSCDLIFFSPLMPGSEQFYQQLQELKWYYVEGKQEYHVAKKFVQKDDKVLDVGCGSGAFSKTISHATFTGLELNTKAIAAGKRNGITILNESIQEHSEKRAGYYDVVTAFQVLEHIPQIHDFIASCVKSLKSGGLLIFSVPSNDSFIADVYNMAMNMPPHHISRWSDNALKNIGKVFGLEQVHLEHDKLAKHDRFIYSTTQYEKLFYKDLSAVRKYNLLNDSFSGFLINKFSKLLSVLYKKGINEGNLPYGHSVTVVLKKP